MVEELMLEVGDLSVILLEITLKFINHGARIDIYLEEKLKYTSHFIRQLLSREYHN